MNDHCKVVVCAFVDKNMLKSGIKILKLYIKTNVID